MVKPGLARGASGVFEFWEQIQKGPLPRRLAIKSRKISALHRTRNALVSSEWEEACGVFCGAKLGTEVP